MEGSPGGLQDGGLHIGPLGLWTHRVPSTPMAWGEAGEEARRESSLLFGAAERTYIVGAEPCHHEPIMNQMDSAQRVLNRHETNRYRTE